MRGRERREQERQSERAEIHIEIEREWERWNGRKCEIERRKQEKKRKSIHIK